MVAGNRLQNALELFSPYRAAPIARSMHRGWLRFFHLYEFLHILAADYISSPNALITSEFPLLPPPVRLLYLIHTAGYKDSS